MFLEDTETTIQNYRQTCSKVCPISNSSSTKITCCLTNDCNFYTIPTNVISTNSAALANQMNYFGIKIFLMIGFFLRLDIF